MSYPIKRLNNFDIDYLHQLLDCFAEAFEDHANYSAQRPDRPYLDQLLGEPSFIALVALNEDKVIGGLVAYELKKFEQARSELYIYDLAVASHYRRQGVATELIQSLKPIARNVNASVIYVQADHGDEAPTNLYSKLGVREDVLHFDIDVSDT